MAENRTEPTAQIPEADLVEQQIEQQIEQQTALHAAGPVGKPDAVITLESDAGLADEADLLEQAAQVPGDGEDDYPHDPPQVGRT